MFIHKIPRVIKWLYPQLIWAMPADKKVIYLTFDDGPIPHLTDYILETLKQYDAKATFFCVGDNLVKHKPIAHRVIEQGHALGNHTFNHLNGWNTNGADYFANIEKCEAILAALGQENKMLRPPYGRITRKQIKTLTKDYNIVMWDVLSGDFSAAITPEVCLKKTIKATRSGSIVLFHDNLKAEANVKYALPRFLDHFTAAGYNFNVLPSR